jgi:predicted nucleic acid-binding protein
MSCQSPVWQLIRSTALEAEIDRTPDPNRKQRVQDSLAIAQIQLFVTESILKRAHELSFLNFKSFDALHVACAEAANADILLTTDDRLIRKASQHQTTLSVRVANPITWLMEIMTQTGENHDDPR